MESVKQNPEEQSQPAPKAGDQAAKAAAIILWVVVIAALGYGVVRTAIQAAALFTG